MHVESVSSRLHLDSSVMWKHCLNAESACYLDKIDLEVRLGLL